MTRMMSRLLTQLTRGVNTRNYLGLDRRQSIVFDYPGPEPAFSGGAGNMQLGRDSLSWNRAHVTKSW